MLGVQSWSRFVTGVDMYRAGLGCSSRAEARLLFPSSTPPRHRSKVAVTVTGRAMTGETQVQGRG